MQRCFTDKMEEAEQKSGFIYLIVQLQPSVVQIVFTLKRENT